MRESILLIDDMPDNLELLTTLLVRHGYEVRTAANGKEALQTIEKKTPDLVLLDIMMPGMDGYEICEEIKTLPATENVPIIFLTVRSNPEDKMKAFAAGGVDFVTKPYHANEVLARIETHLTLRRVQQDLQEKNARLRNEVADRRNAEMMLHQYAERLRVLNKIDQSILAARSPSNVALAAVGRLRQLIPCQRVMVIARTESGELQTLAMESHGALQELDKEVYREMFEGQPLSKGLAQGSNDLEALSQRPLLLEALCQAGVCSYMAVPLFVNGDLVGALILESQKPGMFTADHIAIATEVAVLLAVAIRQHRLYEQAQQEREKSEALLLNVLPSSVAQDLKETGRTTPREFNNVSILFSDLIDFTAIAAQYEPAFIISELNELFTAFDNIMERNRCERMKTIGDAYMAVCGLPDENEEHAHNIVRAALDILAYLRERSARSEVKWQIRVGIHSGKVVGGVVGVKKYVYDIFGDAVNTAWRMQTHSQAMQINVSEATYQRVKDAYDLVPRALTEVQGKGLMQMYFVKSGHPPEA
ncbi:MAG: adenylate/guanylate cyclase domain-containing protein [Anaerolineales bacterium]